MSKVADLIDKAIGPLSWLFHRIAIGIIAVMMFLTAADVFGRYVFNRPIIGSYDLTQYMMAIIVPFTAFYCVVKMAHIKIELLVERLPQRAQTIIDSITSLLAFGLFSLMTWQTFEYMKLQYDSGAASEVIHIPAFPFIGIVAIGLACLALGLLSNFLHYLSREVKR